MSLNITIDPITPILNIVGNTNNLTSYLTFGEAPINISNATYVPSAKNIMIDASYWGSIEGE